jgi:hypothetical protein
MVWRVGRATEYRRDNSQHKGLHAPIEGRKLVKAVSGVERTHTKTIPLEDWW